MLNETDFRPQQGAATDFLYGGNESLLLGDVGTGKTVVAQTALQCLIQDGVCERVLVVAPKWVCTEVWPNEHKSWEHLDPDVLRIGVLAGAPLKTRVPLIEDRSVRILTINYELLPWLMQCYPDGLPGVSVLVCDEIDKLKDPTTTRFKGNARKKVPGMKKWRRNFDICIGMTGTPTPNHLLDLWAQVYTIDGGQRLGNNFYEFRQAHFYQSDWAGYQYEVLPGREEWIYERIQDIAFRMKATPGRDTPYVVELPPRWLELPPAVRKSYRDLERHYITLLREDTEVVAEGEAALYGKLRQFAQGFAYTGDEETRVVEWLHSEKHSQLDSLISELQGQQLMVVYHYQATRDALARKYGERIGFLGGGISETAAVHTMFDWNSGRLPILGLHPQSAGHGLNLQKSGAHHIAMLTLPESAGLYQQVIGRLARGGNSAVEVFVHRFLMRDTVDEDRDAAVHGKVMTQAEVLAAMEARNR